MRKELKSGGKNLSRDTGRVERTVTGLQWIWWRREIVVIFEMHFEFRGNRRFADGLHMSKRGLDHESNY